VAGAAVPPRLFTRVVLPLVLFVGIVAAVAWVTQNLPSWRAPKVVQQVPADKVLLQFDQQKAVWDEKEPEYAAEFEFGKDGYYNFPFTNATSAPVEFGLSYMSCGCSKVKACVLNYEELQAYKKDKKDDNLRWQTLPKDEARGLTVPPGAGGIVRLTWEVRKVSSQNSLFIKLWNKDPSGKRGPEIDMGASVSFVMPVQYSPQIKDFGNLGPHSVERAHFWFWSATRDRFDLDVREKKEDPCFVFRATPLTVEECGKLAEKLKTESGIRTRIKAAYRVEVEVHEQRGGRQLDLGPFQRYVPMAIDHPVGEDPKGPELKGWVRGDIVIGSPEDRGHIDFRSFPLNSAKERRVPLYTEGGVKLTREQVPDYLDVDLTEKETVNNKTHWDLRAVVRPGVLRPGSLPDDSAIILRTNSMPPRRIRIPIQGNAMQG
jgi:hypothetical protein